MKTQLKHLVQHAISVITVCFYINTCCAHFDPAYMYRSSDGFTTRNNWMDQLPDDAQLSELALPGTHGSASYHGQPTNDAVNDFNRKFFIIPPLSCITRPIQLRASANQALSIREQLQYGIRVLDVRILYKNDEFGIMLGGVFLHVMFNDFLTTVVTFLQENPSEIVLVPLRIEQEVGENKQKPNARLTEYLKESTVSKYYLKTKNARLKVGDARGKFVILSRDKIFTKNCLDFYGNHFKVMDVNHLNTNWDLHKKWVRVKESLELARKGDKDMFYVTYLTGYGGTLSYFVASGHVSPGSHSRRLLTGLTTPTFKNSFPDFPRVGCVLGACSIAFEGTNVLTRNLIQSYNSDIQNQPRTVGIIMADFPGDSLIANIIENNYILVK